MIIALKFSLILFYIERYLFANKTKQNKTAATKMQPFCCIYIQFSSYSSIEVASPSASNETDFTVRFTVPDSSSKLS